MNNIKNLNALNNATNPFDPLQNHYLDQTSLKYDKLKELYLQVLFEYRPHELFTNNLPVSQILRLDEYGYTWIQQQDFTTGFSTFASGEAYSNSVLKGHNTKLETRWNKFWVDQSWCMKIEMPKRQMQLDSVSMGGLLAKFLITVGKNCIDAYRFSRLFLIAVSAKNYLNEFCNWEAEDCAGNQYEYETGKPIDLILPGHVLKTSGDTIGHTGNVFRINSSYKKTRAGHILAGYDTIENSFVNNQLTPKNQYIYIDAFAKMQLKDFKAGDYGNITRFLDNAGFNKDIKRNVASMEGTPMITVPKGLMNVFFGKVDNPNQATGEMSLFYDAVKNIGAGENPLAGPGTAKDGYIQKFNNEVLTYFKTSSEDSVKDYGEILTVYNDTDKAIVAGDAKAHKGSIIAMISIGRQDAAYVVQQFKDIKVINGTMLPGTLNNFVEMYWSHSVFSPPKLSGGVAAIVYGVDPVAPE